MNLNKDSSLTIDEYYKSMRNSTENNRIIEGLRANLSWNDENKKNALIAARYLNSVSKGEHALELAYALEKNLEKQGEDDFQDFVVLDYIKEAIEWICQ